MYCPSLPDIITKTGGGGWSSTNPQEDIPTRIEAGRKDAGVLLGVAIDDDAAREPGDGALHDLGVLFVAGQRVHDDKVDGRLGRAADLGNNEKSINKCSRWESYVIRKNRVSSICISNAPLLHSTGFPCVRLCAVDYIIRLLWRCAFLRAIWRSHNGDCIALLTETLTQKPSEARVRVNTKQSNTRTCRESCP